MKKYITYEEPLKGRTFTEKQMHEVYRDLADKREYPVFSIWFLDMIRSGVFEEVQEECCGVCEFCSAKGSTVMIDGNSHYTCLNDQ